MNFDDYQNKAAKYDLFDEVVNLYDVGFIEKVLGLVGEAGETADKIKKILRDKDGVVSDGDRELISKELGDTLWYIAAIARYLDLSLSEIADNKSISRAAVQKMVSNVIDKLNYYENILKITTVKIYLYLK